MELKEAIEKCKKFTTEHKLFNIKQADNLEDAIDTVLEELNNRIPIKDIEKYYKDTRKQRRKEYLHKYYVEKIKPKRKKNKE